MSRQIVVGIDIGTLETKVIVAEGTVENGHFSPRIIGTSTAESRGLERGYIVNRDDAIASLRLAVSKAEKLTGLKLKRAFVSFGGIGLGSLTANGTVIISRADLEITGRDISQALETAESLIPPTLSINKRIINTIPIEYKIDGKISWGEPVGLKAQKLEVKTLFITCLEHHLGDLIKVVEGAGLEVVDIVAAPIATSFVTVSKKQRRVGCLLADMGGETMSVIAFENNNPISLEVFPMGGEDLTNDIALGLKTSLEEAENIKLGGLSRTAYSKKKLDEIISTRIEYSSLLISDHLKKIGRDKLLPAGIVFSGGGSRLSGLKALAEDHLNLPAQIAEIHFGHSEKNKIKDNSWATACGLVLLGFNSDGEERLTGRKSGSLSMEGGEKLVRKISKWFAQFLP